MIPNTLSSLAIGGSATGTPATLTASSGTVAVGKYRLTPLVRLTDLGSFAPSVSICSGRGSSTHDRVMRFEARFDTHEGAQRHALEQGLSWLRTRHVAAHPTTH
jgi:hypothetical protein